MPFRILPDALGINRFYSAEIQLGDNLLALFMHRRRSKFSARALVWNWRKGHILYVISLSPRLTTPLKFFFPFLVVRTPMKAISLEFSITSTISLSLVQTLSLSHQDTNQVVYTYAPFQTIPTNEPNQSPRLNSRNSSSVAQSRLFPYTLHLTTESPPARRLRLAQIQGSIVSRWVIHKPSSWRFTRSSSTYSFTIAHSSRSLNSIIGECVGRSGCLGGFGALIAVGCYQRSYLRIG